MASTSANGITIEYETYGDPADPALLLVSGFTMQLTGWDAAFLRALADRGRYVIVYDNRDVGMSTKFHGVAVDVMAVMGAAMAGGELPPVPYRLSDMAADGMGLLDALGIERAHLLGVSMGGMIVQAMAIEHPDRVLTLTSVMSSTGEPDYLRSSPEAMKALLTPPAADRDAYVEQSVTLSRIWSSRRYFDPDRTAKQAMIAFDRSFYPEGSARQLAAIAASGSRAEGLRALRVPTMVMHGRDDTLIEPIGGDRTAELVPGAVLLVLNDMGHDLPEPLWPVIVDAVARHTALAVA
jgi:pimeloyl-ACP methyl ester carboxylesterase